MTQGIRSLNYPNLIFGMDSSKWEDIPSTPQTPNYQTAFERGCKFNYLKATQGLWVDKSFKQDWANCRKTPMKLGAYHFLQWNIDPKKQAEFFYNTIKDDPGELPPCVDFEWWSGNIPSNAFDILYNFLERMKQLMPGKRFVIYTAYGFWMQYGRKDPYWKQYLLWLAHYNNTPPVGPQEIPTPWVEWFLWQWTGHGDGLYYGMESKDVDLDYANLKLYNEIVGELSEEEPDPNQGEPNMYRDNAIGIYLKDNPKWTNPAFNFVVAQGGNWYGVNPHIKTITSNAAAKGLPLIIEFDYDAGYYTQYSPGKEELLPPLATDEMYQAFLNATNTTAVGPYQAISVRIYNEEDQHGKVVDPFWLNWGSEMFLKRVSKWRDQYKPGMKIFVATSGDFIQKYSLGISNWINKYEPYVVQDAKVENSFPLETEKPRYYTPTWKFWEYYQSSINQGLVLFNGNLKALKDYLQVNLQPKPEEPEVDEKILKMKVTSPTGLRVRNAPNTITGRVLSTLKYNDVVAVYDVAGMTSAWIKISETENRWCCVENAFGRYLTKIQ
jgi:lysozyme